MKCKTAKLTKTPRFLDEIACMNMQYAQDTDNSNNLSGFAYEFINPPHEPQKSPNDPNFQSGQTENNSQELPIPQVSPLSPAPPPPVPSLEKLKTALPAHLPEPETPPAENFNSPRITFQTVGETPTTASPVNVTPPPPFTNTYIPKDNPLSPLSPPSPPPPTDMTQPIPSQAASPPPPPAQKIKKHKLIFAIVVVAVLMTGLIVAVLISKQNQDNRNQVIVSTPDISPTLSPDATGSGIVDCRKIRIYKITGDISQASSWEFIPPENRNNLQPGDLLGITIRAEIDGNVITESDPNAIRINKGRIRQPGSSWDVTTERKPYSTDTPKSDRILEYYVSYQIPLIQPASSTTLTFTFEGEVYNTETSEWR